MNLLKLLCGFVKIALYTFIALCRWKPSWSFTKMSKLVEASTLKWRCWMSLGTAVPSAMFSFKTLATSAPFENLKNLPQPHVRCNRDLAAAGATSAGSSENFASIFKSGSTKVSCSSLCYCCCCCHIKQKVQSILWWKGKCCPLLMILLRFSPSFPIHYVVFYFSLLITFPQGWCRPLCRPPLRRQCLCSRRLDYPHNALSCQRWG